MGIRPGLVVGRGITTLPEGEETGSAGALGLLTATLEYPHLDVLVRLDTVCEQLVTSIVHD